MDFKVFQQKIICCSNCHSNLAICFIVNSDINKKYNLRNLLELKKPDKGNYNDFGEETFVYLVNL